MQVKLAKNDDIDLAEIRRGQTSIAEQLDVIQQELLAKIDKCKSLEAAVSRSEFFGVYLLEVVIKLVRFCHHATPEFQHQHWLQQYPRLKLARLHHYLLVVKCCKDRQCSY